MAVAALVAFPIAARSNQPVSFRVATQVFQSNDPKPIIESLTIFDSGVAYEVEQPGKRFATIIDPARQKVVLLDRLTKVRSTVAVPDLIRWAARVRAAAESPQKQEKIGLAAKAEATPEGDFRIAYGTVAYTITTQKGPTPEAVSDYGRYVDLSARLNIARQLGPPPFARMTLNDALTAANKLPEKLTRTITEKGAVVQQLHQDHDISDALTEDDRDEINNLRGMMELFREVPLAQFPK